MEISDRILNEDPGNSVKADDSKVYDHIGELPDEILSFVLSFLTIRDVVKARTLSPRWRYLFSSTPNLHFDRFTIFGINYDNYRLNKNSNYLWEGKFRFVRAVDQILQQYRRPKIYSFKLHYGLGSEYACDIDNWIHSAVKMQTEKLDLDFSCIPKGCELYNFPCHLLSQGKSSPLKHLHLGSCMLRPPPDITNCLNSLKILDLENVPLDPISVDSILSGCINLESFRLENCRLPNTFSISSKSLCLKLDLCE